MGHRGSSFASRFIYIVAILRYHWGMKILVLYATNSGGTFQSSEIIAQVLKSASHEVVVQKVVDSKPADMQGYDLIILGSPSWDYKKDGVRMEGQVHEWYLPFFEAAQDMTMAGKKFAVYGLGDTAYTYFCGAVYFLEKFVQKVQGVLVVPSLKIDGFYFDEAANKEKVRQWAHGVAQTLSS